MSTALIQEVRYALGFKKQVDLVTPLTAADMWSLRQTNSDFFQSNPVNEDDAADYGKGVYITQTFPSHIQSSGNWNGRLTSEAAAQIVAFGLGAVTKSASGGGFKYTGIAPVFATTGIQLPVTTMLLQIRTGVDAITDKLMVGAACEEFGFEFQEGPGRDNATFTSNWLGTGAFVKPSGVVMPTITDEHTMNAGDITALAFVGFDYLANLRFINTKFSWKNNIRDKSSYYPGSGNQSGYQLRGRIRRGTPTISLTCQVECDSGSSEEDALLAQTSGTGRITLAATSPDNSLDIQFFKLVPKATQIADADGIASYNVEFSVQQHATNGVLQIDAICLQDHILST